MNIDWKLLVQQKRTLVKMRALYANLTERKGRYTDAEAAEALSGVIHLLDTLQDEHRARSPKKPRITIEVRGGVVVDTRSNVPDLEVIIQDHDV